MHDASEAYLIDVPRPVKQGLANYKQIENRLMSVIAEVFGFKYPLHPIVKRADEVQLVDEWYNIMIGTDNRTFLSQADAKSEFLYQFKRYA
ncbi:MAG: hypothetical protein JNM00_06850, partial [Flavobacteriales bacterium]|nr:hypothetical protein [Flavobacteriales bacterium]